MKKILSLALLSCALFTNSHCMNRDEETGNTLNAHGLDMAQKQQRIFQNRVNSIKSNTGPFFIGAASGLVALLSAAAIAQYGLQIPTEEISSFAQCIGCCTGICCGCCAELVKDHAIATMPYPQIPSVLRMGDSGDSAATVSASGARLRPQASGNAIDPL